MYPLNFGGYIIKWLSFFILIFQTSSYSMPTVRELQKKVVTYNGLSRNISLSMLKRVNKSSLLPILKTEISRDVDSGGSSRRKLGDTDIFYTRNSKDYQFSIKAEWNLSEILFHPQEVPILREVSRHSQLRIALITQVTNKYFAFLQIREELKSSSLTKKQRKSINFKLLKVRAEIDGLTGGWFSAHKS